MCDQCKLKSDVSVLSMISFDNNNNNKIQETISNDSVDFVRSFSTSACSFILK